MKCAVELVDRDLQPTMTRLARLISFATTRISFPGQSRLLRLLYPCHFSASRYAEGTFRRTDGLLMKLDSRRHIEWEILFHGVFEPQIAKLMDSTVTHGAVTVDVGANIGAHTLRLAKLVGRSGVVYAFEPNSIVRNALINNLSLNGLSDVVNVRPDALGDTSGEAMLRVPDKDDDTFSNQGLSSIVALKTPANEVPIRLVRFDDFGSEQQLSRLDFIKIDTQGYEAKVIRGTERCLTKFKPIIVFEYEHWTWECAGESLEDLAHWLRSRDYRLLVLESDWRGRMSLNRWNGRNHGAHTDCIAVHAEAEVRLINAVRRKN